MTLVTFSLGVTLAVFVAGSASAAASKRPAKAKAKTTKMLTPATGPKTPADQFSVLNGTVNAASDHEIVGSSAFPNFTTGAVDNYYSMAHSHVDNSPFAEGTASPADTGPIGQTAAAGNYQQQQYADARWPGTPDKATYGSPGGPYASARAGEYRATADASEATNGLSGPGLHGLPTLALPSGFDLRLRQVLAAWKAKWQGPLGLKKSTPGLPLPKAPVPVPKAGITPPSATVTTPLGTVTTPHAAPPVTVPSATLPPAGAAGSSRSLATASPPGDGESLLSSSTLATLLPTKDVAKTDTTTTDTTTTGTTQTDTTQTATTTTGKTKTGKTKTGKAKGYTLVTSGESSLGRVVLGGGQIVIDGIHVTASIANDGTTPTWKADITIGSATIGGVPVTIDKDGVHIAGQGQGLPFQQASDALNGALKQAGIQLFLVSPEVTTCGGGTGTGMGTGSGGGTGAGTSTNSSDQSGSSSSCGQTGGATSCSQSGTGSGTPTPPLPTPSMPGNTTTTSDSCSQPCDQTGTGAGSGSGTGTTTTATTTSTSPSDTTTNPSSCGETGMPTTSTGSCAKPSTAGGTTTNSNAQTGTTTTTRSLYPNPTGAGTTTTSSSSDQMGMGMAPGTTSSGEEETVTATGLHVVFTQPVSPSGVPAQYVEHILGEVFVDSLAAPAVPLTGFGSSGSSSSCLGGSRSGGASSGGASGGGSSSVGGSGSSSSPSGSSYGSSGSQSGSSSNGNSVPAAFAAALKKPLWLLLAYLLWQALVIGTGVSLWHWRRGGDPS